MEQLERQKNSQRHLFSSHDCPRRALEFGCRSKPKFLATRLARFTKRRHAAQRPNDLAEQIATTATCRQGFYCEPIFLKREGRCSQMTGLSNTFLGGGGGRARFRHDALYHFEAYSGHGWSRAGEPPTFVSIRASMSAVCALMRRHFGYNRM